MQVCPLYTNAYLAVNSLNSQLIIEAHYSLEIIPLLLDGQYLAMGSKIINSLNDQLIILILFSSYISNFSV